MRTDFCYLSLTAQAWQRWGGGEALITSGSFHSGYNKEDTWVSHTESTSFGKQGAERSERALCVSTMKATLHY